MLYIKAILILGIALFANVEPALAVENALGRTVPGTWVMPQAGVVGPSAGFSFTTLPIGYMGAIGGNRLVPIGGAIFANVQANLSENYLVPEYVYKTEDKVSFASSFMTPVDWVEAKGLPQSNNFAHSVSGSNAGLGDVVAIPMTAGIHFSDYNNLAISTMVFFPTGQYQAAHPTNLGVGEFTFMPNVAYTYLWKKRRLEFDNFLGFDIYFKHNTVNYQSGTVFHWDGMVIQYLSERVGLGAIGATLTQITPDSGPVAEILHGFEGRASAVGAIAVYVAKVENPGVVLQLRWVNEFKVTNLLKGNAFMFGITLKSRRPQGPAPRSGRLN